jgi:hypothetical protein
MTNKPKAKPKSKTKSTKTKRKLMSPLKQKILRYQGLKLPKA